MPLNVVGNASETYVEITPLQVVVNLPREWHRPNLRDLLALAALTGGAVLIHGYHGGVEDAEIYLPGVLQHLNPALFPKNAQFFNSHSGMTLFPSLIAESVRLLHLPADIVALLWHVATIFGLLLGCLRIARVCFPEKQTALCGVALVASLLTLPVAGTALYIMDQYLTSRSFSTAASMLALASILERRYFVGAMWVLFVIAVHPLMSLFLLGLLGIEVLLESTRTFQLVLFAFVPLTSFAESAQGISP